MRSLRVLIAMLLLVLCLSGSAIGAKVLRIGHEMSTETPEHIALERFAELVAEKTGGEVTVKLFPMNQLGSFFTQLQNIKDGLQEGHVNGLGWPGHLIPEFFIFNTSFAFKDFDEAARAANGPVGMAIRERLIEEHGIRLIAVGDWRRGARHVLSRKPIRSVDDMQGLKIRVPETPSYITSFEAVGASPTPIAFGEVYLALQQGVVEAMECPLDLIYGQKFYEGASYIALTSHLPELVAMGINERFWQSLTKEQQQAIEEAAIEAGKYNRQLVEENESLYMERMKEAGITFIEVDTDAFVEKGKTAPYMLEEKGVIPEGFYDSLLESIGRK
jgi:tripartite ATP-independent transporter DctP family solute receptor